MPVPKEILLTLCERAAEESIGLFVSTNNVHLLLLDIYRAISASGQTTEDLGITICVPSIEGCLFIVRRSLELDP